jgi:large subunit ribosomal protein L4
VVIDDLAFTAPKTKEMATILKALGLGGTTTLITIAAADANVYKSGRNIDKVTISPVSELNALAILQPRRMLVTRAALDAIRQKAGARKKAS